MQAYVIPPGIVYAAWILLCIKGELIWKDS